jgi:hypothetical protein
MNNNEKQLIIKIISCSLVQSGLEKYQPESLINVD